MPNFSETLPLDLFPCEETPSSANTSGCPAGQEGNLILSAYTSNNEDVFPRILSLYVKDGASIADVTYGKGVFWKKIDHSKYDLHFSDIKTDVNFRNYENGIIRTGIDCRNLPYDDLSMDCVVLDPPYMEGFFRRQKTHLAGNGSFASFRSAYSDGSVYAQPSGAPKYHDAVLALYYEAGQEAFRVLREKGIFIVKCQDEVSANKQHLTHIEITNFYTSIGYMVEDLFVVIRTNKPTISGLKKQVHARKNHSYFMVFRKVSC